MANERTHLAYLRTTVSLIGFGITINRFSTYLIQNDQAPQGGHLLLRDASNAGFGMVLLGLATLGFRLASSSAPSFTQTVDVGALEVLYVEKSQHLLDSLIKETGLLVDTMSNMSAEPARLIVNMSPGFYEIRCLQGDGRVNWLKVHKSRVQTVSSDHLQECLQ